MVKIMTVAKATLAQPMGSSFEEISVDPVAFVTEELKGKASILISFTTVSKFLTVRGRGKDMHELLEKCILFRTFPDNPINFPRYKSLCMF